MNKNQNNPVQKPNGYEIKSERLAIIRRMVAECQRVAGNRLHTFCIRFTYVLHTQVFGNNAGSMGHTRGIQGALIIEIQKILKIL